LGVCRRGDLRAIPMATNSNSCPRRHTSRLIRSAGHTLHGFYSRYAKMSVLSRELLERYQFVKSSTVGCDQRAER
jgi:transketolase N-terminal domain/subunit